MSERSVQADVVKKATLKYKASKLRGTTGASVQGPKAYKDFYLVFRAMSGERKEIELFSNERRFAEGGPPKFVVDLTEVVGVHIMNGRRSEFYVELSDGGMCLFETKSSDESMDWVSCFNAVLFAKGPNGEGILQYDVDLQETENLSFHGAGILELRDGELILCRRDSRAEVVRWRLSHIRSFKAKKRLLTIFSGSRSSTGVGEFLFKSDRSVEITHAIETVVGAMAKDKQKSTRGAKGSHSQQSRSQVQNGGASARHWSSSVVESIPDFQPPVVYEDIPEGDKFGAAGYGRLDFNQTPNGRGPRSPTHLTSPEREGAPGRLVRHTSPTHRPSNPPIRAAAPPPSRKGRRDYEDLDLGEDEEEVKPNGPKFAPDNYSRLDRENSPAGKRTSPPRGKPPPPSTARLNGPPLPSRPHVPPPAPKPDEQPVDVPDGLYAAVNKPKRRPAATVHGTRPLPPVKLSQSGSNPDLSTIGPEEYGRLDHRMPPPKPAPEVEYNSLEHVCPSTNGIASEKEEYGKLERKGRQVGVPHVASPPHISEQYGRLELAQTAAALPANHYEMEDTQQVVASVPEEYGRLQHGASSTASNGTPRVQPQEYGRLERPTARANAASTQDDDYNHLPSRPRTSSFNPYGTLSATELEATTNGAEQESQLTPPQGYENTEIRQPSLAYRASIVGSQLVSKPQAPPRGLSPSPSQQRRAHGYVNVDEKGNVRKGSPPLPPAKPHPDTGAAAQASSRISSQNTALKSHDVSNAASSVARRKPFTSVSSDYEETETLDFGLKVSTPSPSQLPPSIPSPQASRRGQSVRNTSSASAESTNKPSVAPKPSKLRTKPMIH